MSAAFNLDIGELTTIARDRSDGGRAKLFAMLAALLVSHWSNLKAGERQQLAELVALLWPRGELADRQEITAALAGRSDIPSVLVRLVSVSVAESARAKRQELHRAPVVPVTLDTTVPSPVPASQVLQHIESEDTDPAPEISNSINMAGRLSNEFEELLEPRENPHKLTPELLSAVLAAGDLARFEVMLAQLTNLRTSLLRRLLRESGNESLAILARSIGMDAEMFQRQWQQWRAQVAELSARSMPPDKEEGARIAAFFSVLTDTQVTRLVKPWRSDSERFFPKASSN